MGNKINVAEILKDKPQGTKLYDLLRNIGVELDKVHTTDVGTYIECTSTNEVGSTLLFDYSKLGTEKCWLEGLRILLPSKNMRDWEKFSWKKGDVLVSNDGKERVIFVKFQDNRYMRFFGKFFSQRKEEGDIDYKSNLDASVNDYILENMDAAQTYIKAVEERCGGKLNKETLEVEKSEFKDGDILCVIESSNNYHYILIYEGQDDEHIYRYVTMLENNSLIIEKGSYFTKPKDYSMRYATEEEKQQLFDALAKKDKAWDAEKKMIVDLKKKVELKPFDKVVVRCSEADRWSIDFFSYKAPNGYICTGDAWFGYCLPYNEETAKLIGTTKNMEV